MDEKKGRGMEGSMGVLLLVFIAVVTGFYGLDHLVMALQGLPLNLDLTPAQ